MLRERVHDDHRATNSPDADDDADDACGDLPPSVPVPLSYWLDAADDAGDACGDWLRESWSSPRCWPADADDGADDADGDSPPSYPLLGSLDACSRCDADE